MEGEAEGEDSQLFCGELLNSSLTDHPSWGGGSCVLREDGPSGVFQLLESVFYRLVLCCSWAWSNRSPLLLPGEQVWEWEGEAPGLPRSLHPLLHLE